MPHDNRHSLEAAYRATTYRVHGPLGPVDLRLDGTRSPALAQLLRHAGQRDAPWCIVTAYNPQSRILPDIENKRRQSALENQLHGRGLPWLPSEHLADSGDGPAWPTEWGAWVAGIDAESARELGAHCDQAAIVMGQGSAACQLVWLR